MCKPFECSCAKDQIFETTVDYELVYISGSRHTVCCMSHNCCVCVHVSEVANIFPNLHTANAATPEKRGGGGGGGGGGVGGGKHTTKHDTTHTTAIF